MGWSSRSSGHLRALVGTRFRSNRSSTGQRDVRLGMAQTADSGGRGSVGGLDVVLNAV